MPVPRGKNHHAALFQVAHGAAADEGLGHLMHFDGAQQPRQHALLFERVLQRQPVDHRRQHAHVIAGGAVDRKRFLARPAENVSAADDDGHLHAQVVHFLHFAGNAVDGFGVDPKSLRTLERFAGKFQNNASVNGAGVVLLGLDVRSSGLMLSAGILAKIVPGRTAREELFS